MAVKNQVLLKKTRRIGIVYRIQSPSAAELARELVAWLTLRDYESLSMGTGKRLPGTRKVKTAADINSLALVVVLGGDGTYLEATRLLGGKQVPILGINMGSLGFLTETKEEELFPALERTLAGKMEFRPRSMIEARIKKSKKNIGMKFTALNDVVLERGAEQQLLNVSIYNEKLHICDAKSDGIVIATPTGSTAYNLAAGGPILHPESPVFAVCPISPHSLTNRPIIFPDDLTLTFKIHYDEQKAQLVVDGRRIVSVQNEDEVTIKKSRKLHYVVRDPKHDYFSILREKLKFGQRA